ncbi:hypothetical protein K431DRAFT_57866 [Polychaeton citri CBS 116435]|uniref:F-box domain-containing protein n=1 Tax=Polychaeton citri CBS 116435 TaxID=1314669 RepID=A0A9P4Q9E6_9PEZI|nr:hypothetical protein K431DRAFT_57866 [Polychaeton citri CBS 116435]
MPAFTPIRVRGKRTGTEAEKGHKPLHRRIARRPTSPLLIETITRASSKGSKRRKRRERQFAMIEQLPVELVEDIFERSQNLDLSAASPILSRQLNHPHLYKRILDQAMAPLLFGHDDLENQSQSSASSDVAYAVRVVNSRFCSWKLFCNCLCPGSAIKSDSANNPTSRPAYSNVIGPLWQRDSAADRLVEAVHAYQNRFRYQILPVPSKLLSGPYCPDKECFLTLLLRHSDGADIDTVVPRDEDIYRAIEDAIKEQNSNLALYLMINGASAERIKGMAPDLLSSAVVEYGCNRTIVLHLAQLAKLDLPERTNLYLELWQWAENTENAGGDDGRWLKRCLRRARP